MESTKCRRLMAVLLCLAMTVCMFGGFASGTARAKEQRVVKVAFFPMDGYHIKRADGTLTGMDVKYLNALRRYADWEIRFVECGSWDEALQLLSEEKIDLVGSAQYSAERAAAYQYADLASGYTFGIVAAKADSSIAYEDFQAMREATFGIVKTYVRRAEFLQYLADNGIRAPKLREYDSTPELLAALEAGEVDAMVHTFMEIREGQRLIGRFAPRPIYYITYQGNDDVMRELNHAIADLKLNDPELESRLMNEFYQSRLDKTVVFTTEEKEYIAGADPIRVGYFDRYYPFLYEEDGMCRGLARDMLEGSAALAGLTLTWQKMGSLQEAGQALQDGIVDVLSYSVRTAEDDPQVELIDYAEVPLVLIAEKESGSIKTLATVPYLAGEAEHAVDMEAASLMICETQNDCLEALRLGKADAVLCDGYLAEYLLSAEMRYYNLEIKRALSREHTVSMAVRSGDTQLAGILEKILLSIDARAVSDYLLERNVYSLSSVSQFLQENSAAIITILVLVIIAIVLVALHTIRDGRKIQKLLYKDVEMDIWNLNHLIYAGSKTLTPNRRKQQFAVAYLNIAQFQRYKVVYGWGRGQQLLASIADILSQCVRGKGEICAKADGDHFALLMSADYGEIEERLRNLGGLIEEYVFHTIGNRIELQMGVYFIPQNSDDLRVAIVYASQAIDFIEPGSGERIRIFDSSLKKAIRGRLERQKLLDSMDIDENFATWYQAKVDIRTELVVGAEALVRFLDPTDNGAVRSPGFFVPYYEQTGRVTEIDFFVFRCTCRMLRRRLDQGQSVVTISCNFSRIHFTKPDFVERLISVLEEYRIPKDLIEVEVTETLVMEEIEQKTAEQTMEELHERGVRLSIDDFGSGYSSLGVIEKIPASVIKLDRSFLLNQEDRSRQVKIMQSIVDLAGELDAQIVCEGVETDADVELMREIGANVAQGYRYARPVPEEDFEKRLNDQALRMAAK